MSAPEFEPVEDGRDKEPTRMSFGRGGFPFYVAAAWLIVVAAYAVYFIYFGVPDLRAWGTP